MAYPQLYVYLDQSAGQIYSGASAVDISAYVIEVQTKRGRTRLLNDFEAGTATITLRDDTGYFNPANTSSPYYPLLPMQKIQIKVQANADFTPTAIWTGYLNIVNTSFSQGIASVDRVTFQCTDAFRLLNNNVITTVAGATAQVSGVRINKILDQIGYPDTYLARDITTTSGSVLQADSGASRQVLDAIRTVQDSEQGAFYVDAKGTLIFKDRIGVISAARADFFRTYDDDDYMNAQVRFDDDILINNVTVTTTGGTAQTSSNAGSITRYFQRNGSRSVIVQTDAESLYIAKTLCNVLSDVTPRIDSVTMSLVYTNLTISQQNLVTAELMRNITLTKAMPGGGSITVYDIIAGIGWNIRDNRFDVTFYTQESIVTAFVLDDLNMGRLDYNGLGL